MREVPQHPHVLVTHTDAPHLYVWNTDTQPDRTGVKVWEVGGLAAVPVVWGAVAQGACSTGRLLGVRVHVGGRPGCKRCLHATPPSSTPPPPACLCPPPPPPARRAPAASTTRCPTWCWRATPRTPSLRSPSAPPRPASPAAARTRRLVCCLVCWGFVVGGRRLRACPLFYWLLFWRVAPLLAHAPCTPPLHACTARRPPPPPPPPPRRPMTITLFVTHSEWGFDPPLPCRPI